MALIVDKPPPASVPLSPEPPHRWHLEGAAITSEALAMAVMVATSGSPGWAVLRVVLVLIGGSAAVFAAVCGDQIVRGVTAGVTAIIGISVGVGIGVMHIVKSDLGVEAVCGAVCLIAGLVLLVISLGALWRVTHRWWRLLALPLAFLIVQFALLPSTVAIYSTNVPATHLDKANPADAGFTYEDVTFHTTDGARLSGWYIPSRNGAAVMVLHGSGSTRSSVLPQAEVIARHGYGVLLFDARGHGRSTGTAMDNGWWGNGDVSAAVTWLQSRPDVASGRIAAVGMSMGGEEALGAAAADSRVRAVVTEGALWRGSMDTGWIPRTLTGYIERADLWIQTAIAGMLTSAPQPMSLRQAVIALSPRPVLLIAGSPEIRGDRYLRDASPVNVQLWDLPDTPHTGGLSLHPAEWEAHVITFLDRALVASQP